MTDLPLDSTHQDMDLLALWNVLWRGRWLIACLAALFAVFGIAYALLATQWFRAEALLVPAAAKSTPGLGGQLGGLGGLASLVGISVGGTDTAEPLAVLQSRDFIRAFIEDQNLMPVLFAKKWDATARRWKNQDPARMPDIRDGVKFFNEEVLQVREDKKSGLVTVAVEWTDANLAASWVNLLVQRLNERMRQRALAESQANVSYLQNELAGSSVVSLQQSIGRVLESELQKAMLARGNQEFSYRFIDRAFAPKERSRPKRGQVVVMATLAGAMLGAFLVFWRFKLP